MARCRHFPESFSVEPDPVDVGLVVAYDRVALGRPPGRVVHLLFGNARHSCGFSEVHHPDLQTFVSNRVNAMRRPSGDHTGPLTNSLIRSRERPLATSYRT